MAVQFVPNTDGDAVDVLSIQALPAGVRLAAVFALPSPTVSGVAFDLAANHANDITDKAGTGRRCRKVYPQSSHQPYARVQVAAPTSEGGG
jgi:hypothetical protein